MNFISSLQELEYELSRPTEGVLDTLRATDGDVMVLGAGGKMGPTLSRMLRRGLDQIELASRRVIAVSRFSSEIAMKGLNQYGVETISCDLLNREAVEKLPDAPNTQ